MSSKNTVHRVSAPDTTEGTKKRNAEIEAKRREEERPRLERGNPNAVSADELAFRAQTAVRRDAPSRSERRAAAWRASKDPITFVANVVDGALEGLEQTAPRGKVAGVNPFVPTQGTEPLPGGKPLPEMLASTIIKSTDFENILNNGRILFRPSIALANKDFALPIDRPYSGSIGSKPNIVVQIPLSMLKNKASLWGSTDLGTPMVTVQDALLAGARSKNRIMQWEVGQNNEVKTLTLPELPEELRTPLSKDTMSSLGEIYESKALIRDKHTRELWHEYLDTVARMIDPENGYMGTPNMSSMKNLYITRGDKLIPEQALPTDLTEKIVNNPDNPVDYGEIKYEGDLSLDEVIKNGGRLLFAPTSPAAMRSPFVQRVRDAFPGVDIQTVGPKNPWDREAMEKRRETWLNNAPVHQDSKGGETRADTDGGAASLFLTGVPTERRGFSKSFERKPKFEVRADKSVVYYPELDNARSARDIGGYRYWWSDKEQMLKPHVNDQPISKKLYETSVAKTNEDMDRVIGAIYKRYGVDPERADPSLRTAVDDLVFVGGGASLNGKSPKLEGIVRAMRARRWSPEDAFALALSLEGDTYGERNYRRQAARGALLVDALARSKNNVAREYAKRYADAWRSASGEGGAVNEDAYGTTWTKHAAGMREASKLAEMWNLDFSRGFDKGGTRQDAQGGDTGEEAADETVSQEMVQDPAAEVPAGGPRIAVNPAVFHDKRDALCVSLNEAFRIIMELNGFEPQAEPTEAQRRFFADTAYANDELQLRRTILARICTFDTSIQ